MELKDTVDLMLSDNYKDRLKAEYYQTLIRHDKLSQMILNWRLEKLDYTPVYPIDYCNEQLRRMRLYLNMLEDRARLEGITL